MKNLVVKLFILILILVCFFQVGKASDIKQWDKDWNIAFGYGFGHYYNLFVSAMEPMQKFSGYWDIPIKKAVKSLNSDDTLIIRRLSRLIKPKYYPDEVLDYFVKWEGKDGDSLIGCRYKSGKYRFIIKETDDGRMRIFVIAKPIECKTDLVDLVAEVLLQENAEKNDFHEPKPEYFRWMRSNKGGHEMAAYNTIMDCYKEDKHKYEDAEQIDKTEDVSILEVSYYKSRLRRDR
ncbi:MAG: hypothetical protein GY855_17720 [candidate division Zixibacteria bacterium]|nr:hypothetical protein [candidate division Zixibacteria bacterium]